MNETIENINAPMKAFVKRQSKSSVKMPLKGAGGSRFPISKYRGRLSIPRIIANDIAALFSPVPCPKRWQQTIIKMVKVAKTNPPKMATFDTARSVVFLLFIRESVPSIYTRLSSF